MAMHAQMAAGGGAIGQHDVQPVSRQFGDQIVEIAFLAYQPHRFGQRQHDFEQTIGDQLGQGV